MGGPHCTPKVGVRPLQEVFRAAINDGGDTVDDLAVVDVQRRQRGVALVGPERSGELGTANRLPSRDAAETTVEGQSRARVITTRGHANYADTNNAEALVRQGVHDPRRLAKSNSGLAWMRP